MPRPKPWLQMVRAAKSEALLAVKLYNEPLLERSLEGFSVHMHLAWLYLLQAEFLRDRVDFRYPHQTIAGRFAKIDGEYSTWDLKQCAKQRWENAENPVRANLEFFIKFRNKTEHRYNGHDAALFAAIADKSQALLLNFEEELTEQFGQEHSLATQLRFPVFIGTFTEPAEAAMRRLRQSLPADMKTFLAEYDAGLNDQIKDDTRYSFKLRVQLQSVQRGDPDLAIRFVREDTLSPEEVEYLEDVGQTGTVVVREHAVPISNEGLSKFTTVASAVNTAIPFDFNRSHLTSALRIGGIRPFGETDHPERTLEDFCVYDSLNNSYNYKPAYIAHLIRELQTPEGFLRVTGRSAIPSTEIMIETNSQAAT